MRQSRGGGLLPYIHAGVSSTRTTKTTLLDRALSFYSTSPSLSFPSYARLALQVVSLFSKSFSFFFFLITRLREIKLYCCGSSSGTILALQCCFIKDSYKKEQTSIFIRTRAVARSENPGGGACITVVGIICPPG